MNQKEKKHYIDLFNEFSNKQKYNVKTKKFNCNLNYEKLKRLQCYFDKKNHTLDNEDMWILAASERIVNYRYHKKIINDYLNFRKIYISTHYSGEFIYNSYVSKLFGNSDKGKNLFKKYFSLFTVMERYQLFRKDSMYPRYRFFLIGFGLLKELETEKRRVKSKKKYKEKQEIKDKKPVSTKKKKPKKRKVKHYYTGNSRKEHPPWEAVGFETWVKQKLSEKEIQNV